MNKHNVVGHKSRKEACIIGFQSCIPNFPYRSNLGIIGTGI